MPYEAVRDGKLPFKYEDVKGLLNNKNLIVTVGLFLSNIVVFNQVADAIRYLSRNRDSICAALQTAISYTFMLVIGYALLLT